jgi:hypothetical protein
MATGQSLILPHLRGQAREVVSALEKRRRSAFSILALTPVCRRAGIVYDGVLIADRRQRKARRSIGPSCDANPKVSPER